MTAVMPERPTTPTLQERINAALEPFFREAAFHAQFSDKLWNALVSPRETTTDLTIRGVPVTLTAAPGPMDRECMVQTKDRLYSLRLWAGARVHVDASGRVDVEPQFEGAE
ncbi:MAG TPA: hypothetical protein VFV01_06880 [Spirillospora sp.]|nr:hypothetical protein [Spirillospora sp.]